MSPGVYVEEIEIGAKPIEGVSTSTVGMVGVTQKGPLDKPTLITSFAEFRRIFGGYLKSSTHGSHRYLPHAVEGFFQNGGQRVYVTRVAVKKGEGKAAKSSVKLPDNHILATTLSDATAAGDTALGVASVNNIEVGDIVRINDGAISEFIEVTDISDTTITITPSTQYPHSAGTTIEKMAPTISVEALNEGEWGDKINIKTYDSAILKAKVKTAANAGDAFVELNTTAGIEAGTVLKFPDTGNYGVGSSVSGNRVFLTEGLPVALAVDDVVTTCEFKLVATYDTQEVFDKLSMDENHSRFFEKVINDSSQLIRVKKLSNTTSPPDNRPLLLGKDDVGWNLVGGQDGVSGITDENVIGVDDPEPANRTGLQTLKNIDQISIVAIPNGTSQDIQNAMITHCELMKDRFAVLDPVENYDLTQIQEQRSLYDSKYAALYYPWGNVNDPYSEDVLVVPPSGHICGIYARSDTERGVHKAPANEVVRGMLSLERRITKGQQDILNPLGVNCLRVFRGRGLRVWGARTISSNTLWKYVNVRRLFLFLEESIEEGTQWVVFEPNDEKLWARVKQTITQFLTRVWKDGALMGSTPEEAFFVKCDRTTMTQDDIDNGRLIVLIGVAPVKPAEFVIFRIAQWAGGSEVTE